MWILRKTLSIFAVMTVILLCLSIRPAHAQYSIGGISYASSQPQENLTATFTVPEGGVSANAYRGYVLLDVTGVGQSYAVEYNDAFYLYTGPFAGSPANGHDGGYYQLTFDSNVLPVNDRNRNAENFVVGGLPTYSVSHEYTFILNTGLSVPGRLHFGVSDVGYSDNTGAYQINIKQLTPVPEPSPYIVLGLGVLGPGALILKKRRA